MKKDTAESFIKKARIVHGDKYNYDRLIYTKAHDFVEIICPLHGNFQQRAYAHLSYGCRLCGDAVGTSKRVTSINAFIEKARDKHGDKFSYERVSFKRQHDLIEITCSVHGVFNQAANDHLKGRGCDKCGRESSALLRSGPKRSTEDFITHAKQVHGEVFSYDLTSFCGSSEKITITCEKHGDFTQLPNNHLAGYGCFQCAVEGRMITFEQFVARAKEIHDDRYVYDPKYYTRLTDKVGIKCSVHDLFFQTGTDHIFAESNCPRCVSLDRTKSQNDWLDMMGVEDREVTLRLGDKQIRADGFDPRTNTVYEFWGDFWHGNPVTNNLKNVNSMNKTSFGELHDKTVNKRRLILEHGFKLIEIWESDWRKIRGRRKTK